MKYTPAAKPLMLMTKTSHTCLIVSSMASLVLLMMVLYGTMSSQQPGGSSLRHDYQLLGRPLYKLDLSWPKNPELYTGDVFGVAVNQYAGVVYVAQRGNHTLLVKYFRVKHHNGDCVISVSVQMKMILIVICYDKVDIWKLLHYRS